MHYNGSDSLRNDRPISAHRNTGTHNAPDIGDGTEETFNKALSKKITTLRRVFTEHTKAESVKERRSHRGHVLASYERRITVSSRRPSLPVAKTAQKPYAGHTSLCSDTLEKGIAKCSTAAGNCPLTVGVIPRVPSIPHYKAWSYLVRNEVALEVGRKMFYTDSTGETVPASDSEDEAKGDNTLEGIYRQREIYVITQIFKEYGSSQQVIEALASKLNDTKAAVEMLSKEIENPPSSSSRNAPPFLEKMYGNFDNAFCRRCRTYNCRSHRGEHVKPHRNQPSRMMHSIAPCGQDCWMSTADARVQMHGADGVFGFRETQQKVVTAVAEEQAAFTSNIAASKQPTKATNPAAPLPHSITAGRDPRQLLSGVVVLTDSSDQDSSAAASPRTKIEASQCLGELHDNRHPLGLLEKTCSASRGAIGYKQEPADVADVLQAVPSQKRCSGSRIEGMSTYEDAVLERAIGMYGTDSCKIARLLGTRTCSEVATLLKANASSFAKPQSGEGSEAPPEQQRGSSRRKNSNQQRKMSLIAQRRSQHKDSLWEEYTPCSCPGVCGTDCPCLASDQYCEKFCACGPSCMHFFPGCLCSGGCRSRTCPCFAAGFECDPDICSGCQCAAVGGDPPPGKEVCRNMRLRLRQHKRIAVGLSSIAGWGAFLMEPVKKNELVGEYTGELVDQDEAERRGKVYDRDDNSYLFNLNHSWVIDARTQGNKLRFANHSTDPNCMAKIMMVDGDHRVGIFALRDIPAGQELLYNYLYTQEQAPNWAKIRD